MTRQEATKKFLISNKISVGSSIIIHKRSENFISWDSSMDETVGKIGVVVDISYGDMIGIEFPNFVKKPIFYFEIESLNPTVTIPFTNSDSNLFKGEWVVATGRGSKTISAEHMITGFDEFGVFVGGLKLSYDEAYKILKFSNGETFGKSMK